MATMYRVVEMQPNDDGRLTRIAPVWQPTLQMARQMARAIDNQSIAARIYIEDSRGNLVDTVRGYGGSSSIGQASAPAADPFGSDIDDAFSAQNWNT